MRAEIARIQRDLQVTTIYVTHDQSEAMTLGDRVAVMRHGVLQQFAKPQELYDRPVNLFVAEFIGSPAMNLVESELVEGDGSLWVRLGDARLRIDDAAAEARPALRGFVGRPLVLGIRPEDIEDAALAGAADGRTFEAVVDIREDMGSEVYLHFGVGHAQPVDSDELREVEGAEALAATKARAAAGGTPFVARVDRTSEAREGQLTRFAVDTRRLHFFDRETGLGVYAGDAARAAAA
jgi:multiple sugar transport system ATP-binding protein